MCVCVFDTYCVLPTGLCELLPMDHIEGLVETIRVFGNLTHFKEVRDILTKRAGQWLSLLRPHHSCFILPLEILKT